VNFPIGTDPPWRRDAVETGAIGEGSARGVPWPSWSVATSVASRAAARR